MKWVFLSIFNPIQFLLFSHWQRRKVACSPAPQAKILSIPVFRARAALPGTPDSLSSSLLTSHDFGRNCWTNCPVAAKKENFVQKVSEQQLILVRILVMSAQSSSLCAGLPTTMRHVAQAHLVWEGTQGPFTLHCRGPEAPWNFLLAGK